MQKIGLNKALVGGADDASLITLTGEISEEIYPQLTRTLLAQSVFKHNTKAVEKYSPLNFVQIDKRGLHNDCQVAIKNLLKSNHTYFKEQVEKLEFITHNHAVIRIRDIVIKTSGLNSLEPKQKGLGLTNAKRLPQHRKLYVLIRYLLRIQLACIKNNIPVGLSAVIEKEDASSTVPESEAFLDTYKVQIVIGISRPRASVYIPNGFPENGKNIESHLSEHRKRRLIERTTYARQLILRKLTECLWVGERSQTLDFAGEFSLDPANGPLSDPQARMASGDMVFILDLLGRYRSFLKDMHSEDGEALIEEISTYSTPTVAISFYMSEFAEIVSNLLKFNNYDSFESSYIPRKTAAL